MTKLRQESSDEGRFSTTNNKSIPHAHSQHDFRYITKGVFVMKQIKARGERKEAHIVKQYNRVFNSQSTQEQFPSFLCNLGILRFDCFILLFRKETLYQNLSHQKVKAKMILHSLQSQTIEKQESSNPYY